MSNKIVVHKLLHWEYWPTPLFYIPNLPTAFYLAIKARNPVFFTAVNPAIKNSGDGMESKYKTIQLIPEQYRPKTILVAPNENFETTLKNIELAQITFPLIAKPDVGFRGILVQKINSESELKKYLKYPLDIILQEFISYKNECGIFYHRIPNEKKGTITSITLKKFLTVIADGTSTLSGLILADKRARLYYTILKEIHQDDLFSIPKKGEEILLTVIGNHSKGTQFIDGNHLINEKLSQMIDTINHQINGWYYGRLDIKYDSFEKLMNGKDFKILEINGIISEATHVFDSSQNSYFSAVKAINKHWKIIYKIGTINNKINNIQYTKASEFIKEMMALRKYSKKIKKLGLS